MADYKVTDTQLSSIADAIRTRGGTSEPLEFPDGFVSAVTNIPQGGDNTNYFIAIGISSGSVYDTVATRVGTLGFANRTSGNGAALTGVEMTEVTAIGTGGFRYDSQLETASFPKCVTIGDNAFSSCAKLSSAYFPECVTIGASAFQSCSSLGVLDFPKCKTIGTRAFSVCTGASVLNFPELETIPEYAFNYTSPSSISFPKCKTIGQFAFEKRRMMTSISFPVCETVWSAAFTECERISEAYFPECTTLYSSAFRFCSRMTTASFPKCVSMYSSVFQACYMLLSLYLLGSSVCNILGANVFDNTPIGGRTTSTEGVYGSVFVPASLVDAYKSASYWSDIADRITAYTE